MQIQLRGTRSQIQLAENIRKVFMSQIDEINRLIEEYKQTDNANLNSAEELTELLRFLIEEEDRALFWIGTFQPLVDRRFGDNILHLTIDCLSNISVLNGIQLKKKFNSYETALNDIKNMVGVEEYYELKLI